MPKDLKKVRDTRQSDDFMVIARIESFILQKGIKDALKRAEIYSKAGADAILIHSKKSSPNEIFEFSKLWKGSIPLVVVPTTYPTVSLDDLIENKFKMIIYANQTLRAAYSAMNNVLKQLDNSQRISDITQEISSMEDIFNLQEMYEIKNQEKIINENLKKMGYI